MLHLAEETMSTMNVVEWLRPLVDNKAWDYVVVWKYGNDPTRFIEWMGCCCGGNGGIVTTEEVMGEEEKVEVCRDTRFQHGVATKTCLALSQLPFAMSLYSGVHGEVAISQQPRWLTREDSVGTLVLIPILGGLVELFTAKLVPKDVTLMEFISANYCVSIKQEAISAQSYINMNLNEHYPLTPSIHLPASNQCSSNPSIEGPSSGSNPSVEYPSNDSKLVSLVQQEHMKQSAEISPVPKAKRTKYNGTIRKCKSGLSYQCGNGTEDKAKLVKEPQKEGYHSKNLAAERNRRNRIKKGLFTLRSLVPKITKMDRASILGDAIDYIKELQRQEKELQEEVSASEVGDSEKNTPQLRMPREKEHEGTRNLTLTELDQSSSDCTKKTQMKVQVEVNNIGRTDFFIKICCEQKQGGFSRLMEALHSFGLHVTSANMTTFDGRVLNILTVETTERDIHPAKLKEYLIQQAD